MDNVPPRWAFYRVEVERCARLRCEPNIENVEVWLRNPDAWPGYTARAREIVAEVASRSLDDRLRALHGDLTAAHAAAIAERQAAIVGRAFLRYRANHIEKALRAIEMALGRTT